MTVVGGDKLDAFIARHAQAKGPLQAWRAMAGAAKWKGPQDIKDHFRSASFLADNRVIFNIKGNSFRLVVKVSYQPGIVLVEWVGTHTEYDKKKF